MSSWPPAAGESVAAAALPLAHVPGEVGEGMRLRLPRRREVRRGRTEEPRRREVRRPAARSPLRCPVARRRHRRLGFASSPSSSLALCCVRASRFCSVRARARGSCREGEVGCACVGLMGQKFNTKKKSPKCMGIHGNTGPYPWRRQCPTPSSSFIWSPICTIAASLVVAK